MTRIDDFLALVPSHAILDDVLDGMTNVELASLYHSWRYFWARDEQVFPETNWRMRTFLGARRSGKTRAVCEWLQEEAERNPRARIILLAQNEQKAVDVLVNGDSGLLATAPPWNKSTFESNSLTVHWANGAYARVLTPERPDNIRGDGWTHGVFTELQSWPRQTREAAFMNLQIATSAPPAKIAGDCTPPKRGRHPLLDELIANAEREPERHIVVHARIEDNANNLADGLVDELRRRVVGAQARAELDGRYDPTAGGALFDQEWIDDHRRAAEPTIRRVLAVDPAISQEDTSDKTGIIEAGLTKGDQALVFDDYTDRYAWHAWAELVLDRYVAGECDLIIIERNRGGDACVGNLRAAAKDRGLRIEVVDRKWTPRRTAGVVYVREINSKGPKAERAAPVATLYEKGKVSHAKGAPLTALENLMTSWVPPPEGVRGGARRSPDALDALVMAVGELLGIGGDARPDPKAAMAAAARLQDAARGRGPAPTPSPTNVLPRRPSGGGWGNRL